MVPLEATRFVFYVDPETGRLLANPGYVSERERTRQREAGRQAELHERMRPISGHVQAHRIGGIWYSVDLQPLPAGAAQGGLAMPAIDAVLGRAVDVSDRFELQRLYGRRGVYGARRRELSYRERRELGLAEQA